MCFFSRLLLANRTQTKPEHFVIIVKRNNAKWKAIAKVKTMKATLCSPIDITLPTGLKKKKKKKRKEEKEE